MKNLFQLFFRATILPVVQLWYRVQRIGLENVPSEGGVLLLSNHISYIDAFVMYLSSPRPVRFVVLDHYVNAPSVGWFLRLFGAIPIRPGSSRDAIQKSVAALEEGGVVCLFPEGNLTRTGVPGEMKKGFELIVRKAKCPVVPVFMDGLWNSIFTFERKSYFNKWPNSWTCPLQVAFGKPIPPEEADRDTVRQKIWEASIAAFSARRPRSKPLEAEVVRAFKKGRRELFFSEQAKSSMRHWKRYETLGLATGIARKWMASPASRDDRIGILLPPGPMPSVIALGLFLAGKTPVLLPFSLDQEDMEKLADSVRPLGLKTVISSKAFIPLYTDFWPEDEIMFIDMKAVLAGPGKGMLSMERARGLFEPAWLTNWRLDFSRREVDREAFGLVLRPGGKAVFLNSREVLTNALQIGSVGFVEAKERIFNESPLNRGSGFFLGLWVPLFHEGSVVSRSFSLQKDDALLVDVALQEQASLMVGTAGLMRELDQPLGIASLSHVVVFDEIHSLERAHWEEKLHIPVCRAWEEEGRVITMNGPDPNEGILKESQFQIGRKPRSIGRFLPGVAGKLEDGVLFLKNVSRENETGEVEWVQTRYEATIDDDNFVYLSF